MPHTLLKTDTVSPHTLQSFFGRVWPWWLNQCYPNNMCPKNGRERSRWPHFTCAHTHTHEYTCIVCRIYICMCMLAIAKEIYSDIYSNTFVGWLVVWDFLFFIYMCTCVCKCPRRPSEDIRFSETGMTGSCDLSNVGDGNSTLFFFPWDRVPL